MKALNEAWFEFRGVRSDQMGIELLSRPVRQLPAANGERVAVSGRSGRLWLDDGSWDDVAVEVACIVPSGDMDGVAVWLTGSGGLRFSDEPERMYRARVSGGVQRVMPFARLSAQQFTLKFDCEPFRYLYPEAEDIVLTGAGMVENPGTVWAQPRIAIEGSGDITLSVGGCLMVFEGIDGGIVVDCELMDCLSLDGAQLLNACADIDEFPRLQTGANAVSWTGEVTRVTITPRWRFL